MGKQENADLKVGATKALQSGGKLPDFKAAEAGSAD